MTAAQRRRRVLLVGPLPPPVDGNSVAFNTLVDHMRGQPQVVVRVVNLSSRRNRNSNAVNARRLAEAFLMVLNAMFALARSDTVYITVAQSWRGFLRDLPVIWGAWLLHRRIVAHLHGGNYDGFYAAQPWPYRVLISATVSRLDAFIALGDGLRDRFARVPGLKQRLTVVPNGIAVGERRLPKRISNGAVHILCLSNLLVEKGYLDVLEAAHILEVEHPKVNVRFHFAGRFFLDRDTFSSIDEMSADFQQRVADWGIEDRVTQHGVVEGDAKESLLESCHIFVLPTYYRNEGQPLSILEAMAYGLPVITTAHAAIPDMVAHGVNGLHVPPRDGHAIASAIPRLIESPDLYVNMSTQNIADVHQRYTAEMYAEETTSIILGDSSAES